MDRVRQYPLFSFFALAFGLTWANWVPRALVSRGLMEWKVPDFMFLVAGYGPALAAVVLTGVIAGMPGLKQLGSRLVRWRVGIHWYAVALFLPAFQVLAAMGLHLLFGGEIHKPAEVPVWHIGPPGTPLWLVTLLSLLMFTLGFDGLGEELGWRGFALPQLLIRHSALVASLFLGVWWALWHLPFALTLGSAMADSPFYSHLSRIVAASIMFTWLFNHTRQSILLAILLHAAGNATFCILPILIPGVYGSGIWEWIVPWMVVAALGVIEGPAHLSRKFLLNADEAA